MNNTFGHKCIGIATAMMLAAGCGNHLTREQVAEYGEIGYADIVSFIVVGYQTDWDEMRPQEMGLSPVYSYSSPFAGFAKKDIDGDGFDELLIGENFPDGSYALYDIYRFNRKTASLIHLASGCERDRFMIAGDGVIVETGSNSADDSFTKGYRIRKGRLVEVSGWDESREEIRLESFSSLAHPQTLCGGYSPQRALTEDELAMFRTVVKDVAYTPLSVATQVVAGTNYRYYCKLLNADGSFGYCYITIFKPLPGQGEPRC